MECCPPPASPGTHPTHRCVCAIRALRRTYARCGTPHGPRAVTECPRFNPTRRLAITLRQSAHASTHCDARPCGCSRTLHSVGRAVPRSTAPASMPRLCVPRVPGCASRQCQCLATYALTSALGPALGDTYAHVHSRSTPGVARRLAIHGQHLPPAIPMLNAQFRQGDAHLDAQARAPGYKSHESQELTAIKAAHPRGTLPTRDRL